MLGHFWSALASRPNGSSRGNNRRLSVSEGNGLMSKRDAAIFVNRLFRQWCKIHEPYLISFKNLNLKLAPCVQIFVQLASQQRGGDEKPRDCLLIPA
jgi:hypothetical protein